MLGPAVSRMVLRGGGGRVGFWAGTGGLQVWALLRARAGWLRAGNAATRMDRHGRGAVVAMGKRRLAWKRQGRRGVRFREGGDYCDFGGAAIVDSTGKFTGNRTREDGMNYALYNGRAYEVLMNTTSGIVADSDDLANKGDRLMFRHGSPTHREDSGLFVAPKGTMCSGFVLGLFIEDVDQDGAAAGRQEPV